MGAVIDSVIMKPVPIFQKTPFGKALLRIGIEKMSLKNCRLHSKKEPE